jgi:hypothetical protein
MFRNATRLLSQVHLAFARMVTITRDLLVLHSAHRLVQPFIQRGEAVLRATSHLGMLVWPYRIAPATRFT